MATAAKSSPLLKKGKGSVSPETEPELVKKEFLTSSQTRPTALGSRLKRLRLAAAHSLRSHVCEPKSIFADVHAAGKNALNFICACGRKLCEASSTGCGSVSPETEPFLLICGAPIFPCTSRCPCGRRNASLSGSRGWPSRECRKAPSRRDQTRSAIPERSARSTLRSASRGRA